MLKGGLFAALFGGLGYGIGQAEAAHIPVTDVTDSNIDVPTISVDDFVELEDIAAASVTAPAAGFARVFRDSADQLIKRKNPDDSIQSLESAAGLDHGALSGLADDDHTQYLLVSGVRAMSGDLDLGSNDLTVVNSLKGRTSALLLIESLRTSGTTGIEFKTDNGAGGQVTRLIMNRGAVAGSGQIESYDPWDFKTHAVTNVGAAGNDFGSSNNLVRTIFSAVCEIVTTDCRLFWDDAGEVDPLGEFQFVNNNDRFDIEGRNAADNGWEDIITMERPADGGLVSLLGSDGLDMVNGDIFMNGLEIEELQQIRGFQGSDQKIYLPADGRIAIYTAISGGGSAERIRIQDGGTQGSAQILVYEALLFPVATSLPTGTVAIGTSGTTIMRMNVPTAGRYDWQVNGVRSLTFDIDGLKFQNVTTRHIRAPSGFAVKLTDNSGNSYLEFGDANLVALGQDIDMGHKDILDCETLSLSTVNTDQRGNAIIAPRDDDLHLIGNSDGVTARGISIRTHTGVTAGPADANTTSRCAIGSGAAEVRFMVRLAWLGVLNISATPTAESGGSQFYAKDVAASSEMFVQDEASNETQLSPHRFVDFTPDALDVYPWIFHHKNPYLGIEQTIDMAKLVRLVEGLAGESVTHTNRSTKEDWLTNENIKKVNADDFNRKEAIGSEADRVRVLVKEKQKDFVEVLPSEALEDVDLVDEVTEFTDPIIVSREDAIEQIARSHKEGVFEQITNPAYTRALALANPTDPNVEPIPLDPDIPEFIDGDPIMELTGEKIIDRATGEVIDELKPTVVIIQDAPRWEIKEGYQYDKETGNFLDNRSVKPRTTLTGRKTIDDDGQIIDEERELTRVVSTRTRKHVKEGYKIEGTKFFRSKSKAEAEAEVTGLPVSFPLYIVKTPPSWLADRGV